jgi:uncharacterized phiE125 gp8 family phage protein
MGLALVAGPALEPVSIAEARAHCRIDLDDPDTNALLAGYILAARQHVEVYTRRALMQQTLDLTLDDRWPTERINGCWRHRIVLPHSPMMSVAAISYVDQLGTAQTLSTDQYQVAKSDTGEWVIQPAYGVNWPGVREQMAAITVRFVAGYGTNPGDVPEPIRQAMLLLIGQWHENREAVITGTIVAEMPLGVEALLFPFRVFY